MLSLRELPFTAKNMDLDLSIIQKEETKTIGICQFTTNVQFQGKIDDLDIPAKFMIYLHPETRTNKH